MVKLLLRWNIRPGKESDYFEYVVKRFSPRAAQLGLRLVESWYTVYGGEEQVLTGLEADSEDELHSAMAGDEWDELISGLGEVVTDLRYKSVPSEVGFQF